MGLLKTVVNLRYKQYQRSWEVEGTKLRHLRIITPDSNDDGKIDHIGKTSNNILDEFSRTQVMISEQYISKNKKEIWYSHSVSHSTGITSTHNIF